MRFTLAGNPNCGKTTLFNALTGADAYVGNWAGVTVEETLGYYKRLPEPIEILDLPGIYSLSPYSPEEIISRQFIMESQTDLIINIADASNLERNLYLTLQLLEADYPTVLALNMVDVAKKEGIEIDEKKLSELLGIPVVPICASKGEGLDLLMQICRSEALEKRSGRCYLEDKNLVDSALKIKNIISLRENKNLYYHAVKLLENDEIEAEKYSQFAPEIKNILDELKSKDEKYSVMEGAVADARYNYISKNLASSFVHTKPYGSDLSDKIDRFATNKYFGIPIFMLIMLFIFHFTFSKNFLFLGIPSPAVAMQNGVNFLVESLKSLVGNALINAGTADWVRGLFCDGVISGVGAVLGFLPQILTLFFFLSVLEDSGYMARGAFLMDRILKNFGLSGKAFMPLLMGFGCSVPAVMGTRTLESKEERRMTIFLIPFFSCGAKMPIWATFCAAVFPKNSDLVVFGIYFFGIFTAVITSLILKNTALKAKPSPFALEMPKYHFPRPKSLAVHVFEKMKEFLIRAATVILIATVVIWVMSNFSFKFQSVPVASADSMLGKIAEIIVPVFSPLGFARCANGAGIVASLLTGLIAREMVVSSLGVVLGGSGLIASLSAVFTPASALSFMVFNLLSIPCMATVAAVRSELKSKKCFAFALIFWFLTAWIMSFAVYNIALLFS